MKRLMTTVAVGIGGLLLVATQGGAQYDIVRAEFLAPAPIDYVPGVYDDTLGDFFCDDSNDGWDYVDDEDACTGAATDGVNSDLSGGGRWHLHTGLFRKLFVDFSAPQLGADCIGLNDMLATLGGCGCEPDPLCQLQMWISADRVFKNNATRQNLGRFDSFEGGPGPDFFIDHLEDLYICDNPDGDDTTDDKRLQTAPCDLDPFTDGIAGGDAEVVQVNEGGVGGNVVHGVWRLPMQVDLLRLAVPGDDGGSDVCVNPDGADKGAECLDDSVCCSNKCKGKTGAKTCK